MEYEQYRYGICTVLAAIKVGSVDMIRIYKVQV